MKKILVLGLILIGLFVISCTSEQVNEVNEEVMEEPSIEEETMVEPELEEMGELENQLDETENFEEDLEEVAQPTIEAKIVKVKTSGLSFSPDEVTINVGDTVEFTTGGTHNAIEVTETDWEAGKKTAKEDGFSVGFGETKEVTFDTPGIYYYVCQPHAGMGMKGKVIVN